MTEALGRRLAAVLGALALVAGACGAEDDGDGGSGGATASTQASASAVETFPVPSRNHVQDRVAYPQTPPVGGDHNPVWQNCGFYPAPVVAELAVHSMEHGAVWITYRADLPRDQVETLRGLAHGEAYVLVSPWSGPPLPSAVVASAWGVQTKLASAADPALRLFVDQYAGKGNAPEPGAPCSGAFGNPE